MTKIDSSYSSELMLNGMPQSSILGHLLFLVFINKLNKSVKLCGTLMYADDMAMFYFAKDMDELKLSIHYDMQTVPYWMEQNRLSLSVSKTNQC